MRCVLMSELQEEVFAEFLKNISAHNIKKGIYSDICR